MCQSLTNLFQQKIDLQSILSSGNLPGFAIAKSSNSKWEHCGIGTQNKQAGCDAQNTEIFTEFVDSTQICSKEINIWSVRLVYFSSKSKKNIIVLV